MLVNSRSIDRIEPAGLRWEVVVDLDVYARATDTFRLQLPGAVDLAEVEAPELGSMDVREQADGTAAVTLTFRKPVLGRRAVRLLGLAPLPLAAPWDISQGEGAGSGVARRCRFRYSLRRPCGLKWVNWPASGPSGCRPPPRPLRRPPAHR